MRKATTTIVILLCTITISFAASIEKAILFNQHGLTTDAKRELIEVIFHRQEANRKTKPKPTTCSVISLLLRTKLR